MSISATTIFLGTLSACKIATRRQLYYDWQSREVLPCFPEPGDEAFGDGDIDYEAVAKHLLKINVRVRQAQQSR